MSKASKARLLTAAVSITVALAASTGAIGDDAASRARGDATRISWLLTVPPDAPVTIRSDFGRFRIPIGYLNERFAFRENPFAPDYGPSKFDIADEQVWPSFSFNFWVPDGGRVRDSQPQVEDDRPVEPDHPHPSVQDFVVLMMSSEPAHIDNFRRAAIKALPAELGKPIKVETGDPKTVAYEGAIRSPNQDRYLRFYVECGHAGLCRGWMVIDHRDMAMSVMIPPDGIARMFDALKIADRLLDAWQVPG